MKHRPKWLVAVLVPALLLAQTAPAAGQGFGVERLAEIEMVLYGQSFEQDPLVPRLARIETDLYGEAQAGTITARMRNLELMLSTGALAQDSPRVRLNATEWFVYPDRRVRDGEPLLARLDSLEMALFGQVEEGTLTDRLDNVLSLVWPDGKIELRRVQAPRETVILLELLTEVDSSRMSVGAEVHYRVADDVRLENAVIIPRGAKGVGRVTAVTQSGPLGRNGLVEIDWGSISAMDGARVPIVVGRKATERNESMELAAGASMAGVLLFGAVGLAAGALVRGEEHRVAVGTTFYAELGRDMEINGLSLVPSRS